MSVIPLKDRWLDKRALAEYTSTSVTWVERRLREGMPSEMMGNHRVFKVAEVEPWLRQHGHLRRDAA